MIYRHNASYYAETFNDGMMLFVGRSIIHVASPLVPRSIQQGRICQTLKRPRFSVNYEISGTNNMDLNENFKW